MTKNDLLLHITQKDWAQQEKRTKTSFWASDCLRPSLEIYWRFVNEEPTNPILSERLLLMQVGKLYEEAIVSELVEMGEIAVESNGQHRVEMEREFVKITGYMDAVHKQGYPIEIKTHYATVVDNQLEAGKPPSDHYCHQLAVYMDFLDSDKGVMISANRANGNIYFSEMNRVGPLLFEINDYCFDLELEYKRFRALMENHIIPMKEPPLDYFYHPELTKELLDMYPAEKIKKAIKGDRVLCDHRWRYQYSGFKDKVIEKEAALRGVSKDALCTYIEDEVGFMMDYLGVEWKQTKAGARLYKKKGD